MKIYGWIIFGLMVICTLISIANDKQKGLVRLITTVLNTVISLYILLTLI